MQNPIALYLTPAQLELLVTALSAQVTGGQIMANLGLGNHTTEATEQLLAIIKAQTTQQVTPTGDNN